MNIDIERLKHDREYWDECDPSSGEATHYDGGSSMDYPSFMKLENGKCAFWNADTNSWKYYHGQGSHLYIPRPAKQWSGDGLPPVGVDFEFSLNGMSWDKRVMLFNDGVTCLMALKDYPSSRFHYECEDPDMRFRPLKSEKERVVEAAMALLGWQHADEDALDCLYDAGFLKMPEGE